MAPPCPTARCTRASRGRSAWRAELPLCSRPRTCRPREALPRVSILSCQARSTEIVLASRNWHLGLAVGISTIVHSLIGPYWWTCRYILYQESLAERMPSPSEDAWPPTPIEDSPYGIISRKIVEVMMDEPAYKLYVSGHRRVLSRHIRSQLGGCQFPARVMHLDSFPANGMSKEWSGCLKALGLGGGLDQVSESLRVPVLAQPGRGAGEPVHCSAPHPAALALERRRPRAGPLRRAVHPGAAPPGHVRVQPDAGGGALRHRRSNSVQVSAPSTLTRLLQVSQLRHVCIQSGLGGGALQHRRPDRIQVSAHDTISLLSCTAISQWRPKHLLSKLREEHALSGACTWACDIYGSALSDCFAADSSASSMRTTLSAACRRCRCLNARRLT